MVLREALLMLVVLLYGFWMGRVGLIDYWPADSESLRNVASAPPIAMPVSQQNALASAGSSSMREISAGNSAISQRQKPVERTPVLKAEPQSATPSSLEAPRNALWQAPTQNIEGNIVISLEAAGVSQEEAQSPPENIFGLIILTN